MISRQIQVRLNEVNFDYVQYETINTDEDFRLSGQCSASMEPFLGRATDVGCTAGSSVKITVSDFKEK
jgi:hypothetical protein